MVSRDTKETALLVAVGMVGFLGVLALDVPDLLAGATLLAFGVLGPAVRDEYRRRQDA